jgi:hypothetical protein
MQAKLISLGRWLGFSAGAPIGLSSDDEDV